MDLRVNWRCPLEWCCLFDIQKLLLFLVDLHVNSAFGCIELMAQELNSLEIVEASNLVTDSQKITHDLCYFEHANLLLQLQTALTQQCQHESIAELIFLVLIMKHHALAKRHVPVQFVFQVL